MKKFDIIDANIYIIVFIFLGICCFLVSDCLFSNDSEYYLSSGWNCEEGEFEEVYTKVYSEKISALKEKYNIECEEKIDIYYREKDCRMDITLCNERFTLRVVLRDDFEDFGSLSVTLACFDGEEHSIDDYSSHEDIINLANEFIRDVGYDVKSEESENHFARLYTEIKEKNSYGSYYYHFDEILGYVGYDVSLKLSGYGFYYDYINRDNRDENVEIKKIANVFEFDGILKPLE